MGLLGLVTMVGCASKYQSMESTNRFTKDPIGQLFQLVSLNQGASLGSLSAIGALTVLMGVVALWVFKKVATGIGLILTGVGLTAGAYYLQEFAITFMVLMVIAAIVGGTYLLTHKSLLNSVKGQAMKLFREASNGHPEERRAAEALLRVGDPKIESSYQAKKKEKQ